MPGNYNGDGVEMNAGGGEPFPEGDYHLRVKKVEPGTIKSGANAGSPKVTVGFQVIGGEYAGKEINFHTVSFLPKTAKGAGMALSFLKCIGEPYKGDFAWDETRWVGRVCKAFVVIEPDEKGNRWNRVKWVNEPDQEWQEANAKAAEASGEPLPF